MFIIVHLSIYLGVQHLKTGVEPPAYAKTARKLHQKFMSSRNGYYTIQGQTNNYYSITTNPYVRLSGFSRPYWSMISSVQIPLSYKHIFCRYFVRRSVGQSLMDITTPVIKVARQNSFHVSYTLFDHIFNLSPATKLYLASCCHPC